MQKDLRRVHQDQDDHARAGVVVQRPQEPAERLVVIQVQQAVICLGGRRHVDQGEADAGEDLNDEEGERRAAENVPPAHWPGHLPGDGVPHHRQQSGTQAQPGVEPVPCGTQPASHGATSK